MAKLIIDTGTFRILRIWDSDHILMIELKCIHCKKSFAEQWVYVGLNDSRLTVHDCLPWWRRLFSGS